MTSRAPASGAGEGDRKGEEKGGGKEKGRGRMRRKGKEDGILA